MPVDLIITVSKFFHDLMRGSNYLQNEEDLVELDSARDKATEVMKRLLHTQKVRRMFSIVTHIISYSLYILYTVLYNTYMPIVRSEKNY
jgi:hypothetical protein